MIHFQPKYYYSVTDKNASDKMESHYGIAFNDTSLDYFDSEPELEEKLNFIENGTDFNCDLECSSGFGPSEKDLSWPIFCLVGSGLILFISIAGYVIISKFDHRRLSSCAHARMSEKTPLTIHNNENTLSPIDNRHEWRATWRCSRELYKNKRGKWSK